MNAFGDAPDAAMGEGPVMGNGVELLGTAVSGEIDMILPEADPVVII